MIILKLIVFLALIGGVPAVFLWRKVRTGAEGIFYQFPLKFWNKGIEMVRWDQMETINWSKWKLSSSRWYVTVQTKEGKKISYLAEKNLSIDRMLEKLQGHGFEEVENGGSSEILLKRK